MISKQHATIGMLFFRIVAVIMAMLASCDNQSTMASFSDQITVFFKTGTTLGRVLQINDTVGAKIVTASAYSPIYRLQLPSTLDRTEAFTYYESRPEVELVLPATNVSAQ
jgi:hypothetical protein